MWKDLGDKICSPLPGNRAGRGAPLQMEISIAKWETDALFLGRWGRTESCFFVSSILIAISLK